MAEQFNQNNNSGGGGSSSSSVSYSAATSITSAGTYSNQTYTSTTDAENAVLVSLSLGTVNLVNPTVNKSGGPTNAGDNYNFYGINSGVMAMGGGTVSITGGTITTTGVGANGVFSYGGNGGTNGAAGDGTTVYISDATIKTSASGSGGIMTTGGGNNLCEKIFTTCQIANQISLKQSSLHERQQVIKFSRTLNNHFVMHSQKNSRQVSNHITCLAKVLSRFSFKGGLIFL